MDGDSTQKPNQTILCANNCGFFGNPLTGNLCSKCFRDKQKAPTASPMDSTSTSSLLHTSNFNITPTPSIPTVTPTLISATTTSNTPTPTPSISSSVPSPSAKVDDSATPMDTTEEDDGSARKVQNDTTRCWACNKKVGLLGFRCRCEYVFCGLHRYSDKHNCGFDYKTMGREQLSKANPVVKGSKLEKI
eukprot:TRINITY_DN451_c0_g1_i1.p1 TRINITY_DN451_c0_g1~~TRINITY_DN451_c0_g1_i1.p1  ORF type:complete len:190 (-),score=29.00 TRINITY_DN451_c0_g1_i1:385-954(-)